MPKPDAISPTAIVQVFEPLGYTGTHLLKKIARYHRTQHFRSLDGLTHDLIFMKRDIRARSVPLKYKRLELAYRHLLNVWETEVLYRPENPKGFSVSFTESELMERFGVIIEHFREYCVAQHTTRSAFRFTIDGETDTKRIIVAEINKRNNPGFHIEE